MPPRAVGWFGLGIGFHRFSFGRQPPNQPMKTIREYYSEYMRPLACVLTLTMALSARAQGKVPESQTITWVFLNTGAGREKTRSMPKEEVTKMQNDHIGNFAAQFNRGTLIAAGPMGDNGFIRGTVILSVQKPEQVAECFKPDPFVQNDILAVEAHPWLVDVTKFGAPQIPFKLARHTICVVKKGKSWTPSKFEMAEDAMPRLLPSLKRKSDGLTIGGPFLDHGHKLGLLLFYSSNQVQIQAGLEKEPAVARGDVELEFHPQFMGLGTLQNPHEDTSAPKSAKHETLFDGKSFHGWEGDTNHMWRIEKGTLVGGSLSDTVPHNDFLCTSREFKNFDLRLKVKLNGSGFVNGGIQFRSQRLKEPAFEMTGYQADMGEGFWGSLYDESRRNKVLAHTHQVVIQHLVRPNEWNDYIVRCEDNHIRLWLNGVLTVDYSEEDTQIPNKGLIGFQIHGGGKAEASYRDIAIEELP